MFFIKQKKIKLNNKNSIFVLIFALFTIIHKQKKIKNIAKTKI